MPRIVFASQNPGKIRELQALVDGQDIDIIGLADLGRDFDEPVEDGETFLENATIKAVQYAKETGLHWPTIPGSSWTHSTASPA